MPSHLGSQKSRQRRVNAPAGRGLWVSRQLSGGCAGDQIGCLRSLLRGAPLPFRFQRAARHGVGRTVFAVFGAYSLQHALREIRQRLFGRFELAPCRVGLGEERIVLDLFGARVGDGGAIRGEGELAVEFERIGNRGDCRRAGFGPFQGD